MNEAVRTVLAADIGGTNSRLALVELPASGPVVIRRSRHYPSQDFPSLVAVVHAFLAEGIEPIAGACFAVAGPIRMGECHATNLPWVVRAAELAAELQLTSVRLINDFAAVGFGLHLLGPHDLATLQEGSPIADGPIALLGAGTGLGSAFLLRDTMPHRVLASESGHMSFAPENALQAGLLEFLRAEYGHVSYERVVSGAGLSNVYRYLVSSGWAGESPAVRREMQTTDPAAVITEHAASGDDPLCRRAVELFAGVYGAHAGNLALGVLATGGVYLAGGIAPRIVALLSEGEFLQAFRSKGRLSPFLDAIPVRVILNPDVGLLGAAAVAGQPTEPARP